MKKNKVRNLFFLLLIFVLVVPFSLKGKNAVHYNIKGWEYLKKQDNYRAIFSFKNALKRNPKFKESLIGLGNAYYEVEAYQQAYELFNSALKIEKNSIMSFVGLGKTFTEMGNYKGALNYFNRAIKISRESIEAHYGIAYLYNAMGRRIWAKRKLSYIFRIDPFHYDSLLLMGEIKSREKRYNESKKYIEKAIDSDSELPRGFIKYGEILFQEYLNTEDDDFLSEAKHSLNNALSIQPNSYNANRNMGFISLVEKNYIDAVKYFNRSLENSDNSHIFYSLAISYDLAGEKENALNKFLESLKKSSSDSILRARLEDFLVFRDYRIGHPVRAMLNKELYNLALNRAKRNMPDQVVLYLRRSLLLNPMNIDTREMLMGYYKIFNYNRFYINELKELLRLYPGKKYRDRLQVAIIKRRNKLYHKEEYSMSVPPRNVPRVLVLNFDSDGRITQHPDAGEVIAGSLSFAIGQFGRMTSFGIRKRLEAVREFRVDDNYLDKSLEGIGMKIKSGIIEPVDYIVYGEYMEKGGHISIDCKLLDFKKGFVIEEFSISESGKESLSLLSLRTAKRIYNSIPFSGKVLKLKDKGIIVNLGIFDGIKKGDILLVKKFDTGDSGKNTLVNRIIFIVKESDTLVCFASPQKKSDLKLIESDDIVYPLKRRRAKRIE